MKLKLILLLSFVVRFFEIFAQFECAYDAKNSYSQSIDSTFSNYYKSIKRSNSKNALSVSSNKFVPYLIQNNVQNVTNGVNNSGAYFYIIPVVFHVLHDSADTNPGDDTNISDEQIQNQLNELNSYYNSYHIKFCLAKFDLDTQAITGVSRRPHFLTKYRMGIDNDSLMNIDAMPYNRYLNIWIVKQILNDDGSPSSYLGSAAYVKYEKMGVVVRYDYFGKYNSSCSTCNINSNSKGKVLVHEIGHILGLEHVYLGGCSGDNANNCETEGDYICDTPPMTKGNSSCSSVLNTCSDHLNGNDPINNYMAYKVENCLLEFTPGQLDVMYYNIETYFANHIDVDNIRLVTGNQCNVATALFKTNKYLLCDVEELEFTALSGGLLYQWQFNNNTTNSKFTSTWQTDSFYNYTFNTIGEYDVELVVVNSNGDTLRRKLKKLVNYINCGDKVASSRGNWYFGQYAGLEFRQNATISNLKAFDAKPKSTINTYEGCLVQNDKHGNLLFYAGAKFDFGDAFYIFNKNHKSTANGVLKGTFTSAQGGIVIPKPLDSNKYFIVLTNNDNRSGYADFGLRYSVFDKTLDNNNGDIDVNYKNKAIYAPSGRAFNLLSDSALLTGEGIAATPGCDSTSYYFIVISKGSKDSTKSSKSIEIFKVTSSGITHHKQYWHTELFNSNGAIVFSNDGRLVSICGLLFEFDRKIGSLKFIVNLQSQQASNVKKDLCHSKFSNNNKIFYLVNQIDLGNDTYRKELKQYDLKNGQWIPMTTTLKENAYTLQLGPDKKMYVSQMNDNYISVIESPDSLNDLQNQNVINLKQDKINLKIGPADMRSMGGFPNFIDAVPQEKVDKSIFTRITNCNTVYFYTNHCCNNKYRWYFGDGDTAHTNTKTHQYYGKKGVYYVELIIDDTITLRDTIRFGIEGFEISGLKSVCDTSVPAQYSVKKPSNAMGIHKFYYDWNVSGGIKEIEVPYTSYVNVKWKEATGLVKLFVTDNYACKDTAELNYLASTKTINNTISKQYNCYRQFIKGSLPDLVSGFYQYSWKISEDGLKYSDLIDEKSKDLIPIPSSKNKYYKRVVYVDGCYFESNALMLTPFTFENKINTTNSDQDSCKGYIEGSNILNYFPTGDYLWEKSFDKNNWQSTSVSTRNISINFDSIVAYYRRKVSTDSCIIYSNIISIQPVYLSKKLRQYPNCKNELFPTWFYFEIIKPSKLNITKKLKYRIKNSSTWKDIVNVDVSDTSFYVWDEVQVDGNNRDTIKIGDSLRMQFEFTCNNSYFYFSNIVVIRGNINPQITQQPISNTISGGSVADFKVEVNDSANTSYLWQTSKSNTGPWNTILNSDTNRIKISTGNCYIETSYLRAIIYHPCDTITSNVVSLIVNPVSNPSFDYFSKDSELDHGIEPNPDTTLYAFSKDIWIRYKNDGVKLHLDLNPNIDTNYVYVTIRNKGQNPIKSGKLYTYWTWGATKESWPINWTENNSNIFKLFYAPGKHYMGGEINKVGIVLPEIAQYGSYTIVIPWTSFPKKGWYNLNQQKWVTDKINVCLLARIETCDSLPYGMSYNEVPNVKYNIIQNNNIISRNTYSIALGPVPPPISSDLDDNQKERIALNPNSVNGGVIFVRNNSQSNQSNSLCIKTSSSLYFEKAELFIELGNEFRSVIKNSKNISLSGLSHVYGNVYKINATNACIENLVLPADFIGQVETFYAYKDINNRFEDGIKFLTSVCQKDSNENEIGICYFSISDNLYTGSDFEIIESDTTLSICNNGFSSSVVAYETDSLLSYIILDSSGQTISPIVNNYYELPTGSYFSIADDSNQGKHFIKEVNVVSKNETNLFNTINVQFNCETVPFDYELFSDSAKLIDKYNQVVDSISFNKYQLNPFTNTYKIEYRNFNTCQYETTEIKLEDLPTTLPITPVANLQADYDFSVDSCAFVRLNDVNCEGDTIKIGQEFKVYTMDLQYRYTAIVEQYAEHTKGFKYCPPLWDTSSSHISDWQALIYKNNFCEYCRIDFKADTNNVFFRTSIYDLKIQNNVQIFPNPSNGQINIAISDISQNEVEDGIEINIFDYHGKLVFNQKVYSLDKNTIPINLSEFSDGLYFIDIPNFAYQTKFVLIKN